MPVVHRLVKICEHIIPKTTTLFLLNHHTSVYVIHIFAYILSIICIGDMKRHDNPWNRGRWAQSWNNFATAVPCFCHWGWERQVGPESCIENPGCHVWCHFYKGRLVNCWYCTSLRPQLIPLYIWIWARGTDLNLHRCSDAQIGASKVTATNTTTSTTLGWDVFMNGVERPRRVP